MQPLVFIFILLLRFEVDELLTNYQRVRLNLIGSRKQLERIQENIDQLQVCSGSPTRFWPLHQVLVILSGSGYPTRFRLSTKFRLSTRFRLSYQVPAILLGSGHPTRFRSSYQVQVIPPGFGHSTRFRSSYKVQVILPGFGHSTRFLSSYKVQVILPGSAVIGSGSGHPTRFKLPSSLFIFLLF